MTNESQSPLYEADPESLDKLFTDIDKKFILGLPKEVTNHEIERVVEYFRVERVRFVQDQANFVKPGRKSKIIKELIPRILEL